MKTLLIVDDELLIAEGLRDMLARAFEGRLEVTSRSSASAALQEAERHRIDILLTDINMPGMSGLTLHRSILERCPDCLVIYLTGYSDFEYARTALDQHAFAYILKGEGDDVVITTVERALERLASGQIPPNGKTRSVIDEGQVPEDNQNRIAFLQGYITSHLNEDLSLKRLSEVCHLHPVYLSRIFRETAGITVGDFINEARTERAKELLRESRLTVLEISMEMGFATDNYFCRWFKKRTGKSPQHFRGEKG